MKYKRISFNNIYTMLFKYIAGNTINKTVKFAKTIRRKGEIPIFNYAVENPENKLHTFQEYEKLSNKIQNTDKVALKLSSLNYDKILINDIIDIYYDKKINIIIDAESNVYNDKYHCTVNELILKYNKTYPCVTKTYQMYRKDSYQTLKSDIELFSDVNFSTKIVRGAYWNNEVKYGHLYEYKDHTDTNYNKTITLLHTNRKIRTMLATHNTISLELGQKYNEKYEVFEFAHLLGMKSKYYDKLIYNNHIVNVYVPYGPYYKMLPYLSRRLYENIDTIKYM